MRLISAVCFIAPLWLGISATTQDELQSESSALCPRIPQVSCLLASASSDSHVFEGVEKRIEIHFAVPDTNARGLREVSRSTWDTICEASKCTIIHEEPDACFDSYILSESSLFVFRDRMMIKTCGTTVPLSGVRAIIDAGVSADLEPLRMTYSRSSFVFPDLQLFPHNDLDTELKYLETMDLGTVISQDTGILGDVESTYWLVHTKTFRAAIRTKVSHPVMIDCIMTQLSADTRARYFKDARKEDHHNEEEMRASLQSIDESCKIVGKCYDPCGYSCNAHGCADKYFTVHITPEEAFSYASVESTFEETDIAQVEGFVERVITAFQPRKFVITILAPVDSLRELSRHVESMFPAGFISSEVGVQRLCSGELVAMSIMFTLAPQKDRLTSLVYKP